MLDRNDEDGENPELQQYRTGMVIRTARMPSAAAMSDWYCKEGMLDHDVAQDWQQH